MKLAFFDTKSYDIPGFDRYGIPAGVEIKYFEPNLNRDTVTLAAGFDAVCVFVNDTVEDDAGGVGIGGAEAEDGKRGERLLEHVCSPYEWGMRKCTAWSIQCIRFQDAFAQLRAAVTNV